MENNQLPASHGAKYAIVKTSFDIEVAKKNYQQLLQNLAAVKVTKDNVTEDLTKDGREVLKMLEEKKDAESAEPLQWHRDIMSVFNSLKTPLKTELDRINADKKVIADGLAADNAKQLAEQTRINNAKKAIIEFNNKVVNLIAAAKTDADIVEIEKMIGYEKRKTNTYQEFIKELETQCDGLRPVIKDQKENIRALQKLEDDQKVALLTGDISAQTELMEKKEQAEKIIKETSIRIHEKAFDQAATIEIVAPEVADTAPKGRSNWKWRVDDIKLLQKKMPHLVKIIPDDEAIDLLLKTKKQDGSLGDKMEENYFGIVFYNDKTYTR